MIDKELTDRQQEKEAERERDEIVRTHECAECGGELVSPYDPKLGKTILVCGTNRNHKRTVKQKGFYQMYREGALLPLHIIQNIKRRSKNG